MPVIKKVQILKFEDDAWHEWLQIAQVSAFATFFHTPFWATIWCKLYPQFTPICYKITFDDSVCLYFPAVIEKKIGGIIQRHLSMPGGTYGGFIYESKSNVSSSHLNAGFNYLLRDGNWVVRENPFDSTMNGNIPGDWQDDFTQCVNLHGGYENYLSGTEYTHRKNVKKALQAGLQVGSTENWDLWKEYYLVYEKSINRWEKKRLERRSFYSIDFFKEVYNMDKCYRKLWIVTSEKRIASGIICFYWNKHAVAWHGSGDQEFFNLRPNNLLYNHAIEDACTNNYSWFDCNPSGGFEGVIQFKKFLGTEVMQTRLINKSTLIFNILQILNRCSYRLVKKKMAKSNYFIVNFS
jgi:hypothetical protein